MKHYETVTRTTTDKVCTSRTCDLCGNKATKGDEWSHSYAFNENSTEISVTIKHREGYNMSDCGSGTEYEVDLCPDCFKNKLIPWLRSQGASIQEKEWDW